MGEKKYNFQTLKPVSDVDLKIYSEALNFAMEDPSITNIAITGSYGSGKSSIIETYKKQNSGAKFLHISLAHFNPIDVSAGRTKEYSDKGQEPSDKTNEQEPISDRVIEGKIINQLIHQTDPKEILQTDFKIKTNKPVNLQKKQCAATVVVIVALLHVLLFGAWSNLVHSLSIPFLKTILLWSAHYDSLLLSGSLCLVAIIYAIYNMIKTQKYKKTLKKISFQGYDIEIFSEERDSYFDKYLNETLYLFENCGADSIVFEDMDRYNSNHIFEKLREMNTLINNRIPPREVPLRFLYLLRDDIFNNKDRTKFFDYIIPIVPVIDGSNSINKFLSVFKEAGIKNQFKEAFLNDLSLYVDDMRILKNVCNEYIIYSEQISEIELDKDKLLAILVYKNLFPRDFNALQLRKGYVYNLFEQKDRLFQAEIIKTKEQIESINELLESAKNEMLENIDELDALSLPWNFNIYQINGVGTTSKQSRIELIKEIKEHPATVIFRNPASNGGAMLAVNDDLAALLKTPEYLKRKKIIEAKDIEKSNILKKELQENKHKLLVLQNRRLKDVIPLVNEQDVFSISYKNPYVENSEEKFDDVKDSGYFSLIIYLVRNGYIDESYSDYMTYFYPESISANDKNFLRSITDHKKKEYAYSLNDASRILSRLQPITFRDVEVLNYDLTDELLANSKKNEEYISILIKQLEETGNFDYIFSQWENGKEKASFIRNLNHLWPNIFSSILSESMSTEKQKQLYALDTLYYSPPADIKKANKQNSLSFYISENASFLDVQETEVSKIISGLELLGVKFRSINYTSSNKELFGEVYKRNMYVFSSDNVLSMLRNIYGIDGEDTEIIQKSFTLIFGKVKEPLSKYVEDNIEGHLASVLDLCEGVITDSEEVAVKIINHSGVKNDELKEEYIEYLKTPITDIMAINDKPIWPSLLKAQAVLHTDHNILSYYFLSGNKLDVSLIDFINSNMPEPCNFRLSEMITTYEEKLAYSFALDIIKCNDIKNAHYKAIIPSLNIKYFKFEVPNIALDKIQLLIDLDIIPMTQDEIIFMRETYKAEAIHFIVHNIDTYMDDVIDDDCFDHDEMLSLLDEPISEIYKVRLLKFSKVEISIRDKNYSDEVLEHILIHNFNNSDLDYLLSSFEDISEPIQKIIIQKCLDNINSVILVGMTLDSRLYDALIKSPKIGTDSKVKLLAVQILTLSKDDALNSLNSMGFNNYCRLFSRKQAVVDDNVLNKRILEILKMRGWYFKSETQDDGRIRIYGKTIKA